MLFLHFSHIFHSHNDIIQAYPKIITGTCGFRRLPKPLEKPGSGNISNKHNILKILGEGPSFCVQLGSNWHIPGALNYTASACYICCWFNVTPYQG
jgi:hypothetical protein